MDDRERGVAEHPEHSLVTILAVDTVRSIEHIAGLDPDDAEAFLDKVLSFVSKRIERAGGILASFHGDGGLAIFGWPNSLEDHADRACEAAWAIQHPSEPLFAEASDSTETVTFRVGIHSGLVRFRRLRLGVGSNLDLVGATVHMAAALQKQAPPSGILISSKTRELCRSRLELRDRVDVAVSAKLNSEVFELLALPRLAALANTTERYPFAIVGRSTEKRAILQVLERSDETPHAVAVIGEPGIGKSRLAAAVLDEWRQAGGSALVVRGDMRQSTTPFAAMKSLLSAALKRGEGSGAGLTDEDLTSAGLGEKDTRMLGPLLAGREGQSSRGSAQTSRQIARILVEAFANITSERPVLVMVDDLQAVDPETTDCLRLIAVSKNCRHARLLITGRPEAEPSAARIVKETIHLAPLGTVEMEEFAGKLRPDVMRNSTLVTQALQQADGVPFVLEQMLLSLETDQTATDMHLPQSVESLIHGRLNKLSGDAKSVVQVASLLGEETDIALVANVMDCEIADLDGPLEELERLDLLHRNRESRLRFRHAIIAEASATTLPKNRQRHLHFKAIDAISSIYANLNEHYERIAFHAMGAGDEENALEYLWLAGLQARRSAATGSLQLIFERVEECIERLGETADDRYADFVLMACTALVQIGEISRMKAHLPKALDIARKQQQPEKICGALCHMGMLCWFEGLYEEGQRADEEALALAREMESLPHLFAAQLSLANIHHCLGQVDRAIELVSELCGLLTGDLARARLGATGLPSAMSHAFMGWFLVEVGRYDEALEHARKALSLATDLNDTYGEVLSRNSLGRVLLMLHRDEEARQCMAVARDITEREGYDAILPHITGRMAAAMARTGQAGQAVEMVKDLLDRLGEDRTGRLEMFNLFTGYGEALFLAGRTAEAFDSVDRALTIARALKNPTLTVQALSQKVWMARSGPDNTPDPCDQEELSQLCDAFGLVAWAPDGVSK